MKWNEKINSQHALKAISREHDGHSNPKYHGNLKHWDRLRSTGFSAQAAEKQSKDPELVTIAYESASRQPMSINNRDPRNGAAVASFLSACCSSSCQTPEASGWKTECTRPQGTTQRKCSKSELAKYSGTQTTVMCRPPFHCLSQCATGFTNAASTHSLQTCCPKLQGVTGPQTQPKG